MSDLVNDPYRGNYPKAKGVAMARSSGTCQFCGLQKAVEAHHWAWPDYPSGEKVQAHDLTALCKPCHEIATVMRDWVARKDADFDDLAKDLDKCNTAVAKREVISYWLYPEEKYGSSTFQSALSTPRKRAAPYKPDRSYDEREKTPLWVTLFSFIVLLGFLAVMMELFNL